MKKNVFLGIIGVLILFYGCGTMGGLQEAVTYSEVVNVSGSTANDLYVKINMWFVDAFRKADSVIQFSDKDSGIIKGKYISPNNIVWGTDYYRISSIITVEARDERYRISFSDPLCRPIGSVLGGNYNGMVYPEGNLKNQEMADKVIAEWKKITKDLKNSLNTAQSDW